VSVLGHRQDEIEAKAAEWVVLFGGGPLPDEKQRTLESWLAESPAHKAAFDHARSIWADLAALRTAPGALADDIVLPRRRSGFPIGRHRAGGALMLRAAVIAALVLAAGSFGAFWFGNPLLMLEADYSTAPGQRRDVSLADGSMVQLDTDSAFAVHFDGRERRVELLSGEAYFTVAPMREGEMRPFVVASANGTATARGTQFIVGRDGKGTQVTAAEHQVLVSAASSGSDPGSVVLSPGQAVRYDGVSGMGAVIQVDLDQVTAWRRGRLIFDKVRLADVVGQLNRYRRGRIVIASAGLADHRVSGVFETANPEGALASIMQELGARTVALPPFMTVLY
jgi:transmembrane sensor